MSERISERARTRFYPPSALNSRTKTKQGRNPLNAAITQADQSAGKLVDTVDIKYIIRTQYDRKTMYLSCHRYEIYSFKNRPKISNLP